MYKIEYLKSVFKDFRKIPKNQYQKIKESIDILSNKPFPLQSTKLKDYEDTYRLRVGSYRVIYEVNKIIKIIVIVKVGHRKDIYKRLERLLK
jgi:mRNA interferase RelE/StbE